MSAENPGFNSIAMELMDKQEGDQRRCTKCNFIVESSANFCSKCGGKVENKKLTTVQESISNKEIKNEGPKEKYRINDTFSIYDDGTQKNPNSKIKKPNLYIFNRKTKEKVSENYHHFNGLITEKTKLFFGEKGAVSVVLKFTEEGRLEEASEKFHDIYFDKNLKILSAEKGSFKYILDPDTLENLTPEGFHEFIGRNGKIYGEKGGNETEIKLSSSVFLEKASSVSIGDNTHALDIKK